MVGADIRDNNRSGQGLVVLRLVLASKAVGFEEVLAVAVEDLEVAFAAIEVVALVIEGASVAIEEVVGLVTEEVLVAEVVSDIKVVVVLAVGAGMRTVLLRLMHLVAPAVVVVGLVVKQTAQLHLITVIAAATVTVTGTDTVAAALAEVQGMKVVSRAA